MTDLDQPPSPGEVLIQCIDYGPNYIETREVTDLDAFLNETRPPAAKARWINVCGLNAYVVNRLRSAYGYHTLAAEDVLRLSQRPKLEPYEGYLFIVVQMLRVESEKPATEQVSLFLFKDILITFQEERGDMWDPIRTRLEKSGSRLRTNDVSYLLYALLDAVVDHCFPRLEKFGDLLESLETVVVENPSVHIQRRLLGLKRELALLRRMVWPLRELLSALLRDDVEVVSKDVKAYLRDVYDHVIQVIDMVESYREMTAGLNDLYMSAVSNRMNEIMKVLTIMASFFIPITFVAGVYGMNFDHIPELHWKYSYIAFWVICLGLIAGLALFFYKRGWLGSGPTHDPGGDSPGT